MKELEMKVEIDWSRRLSLRMIEPIKYLLFLRLLGCTPNLRGFTLRQDLSFITPSEARHMDFRNMGKEQPLPSVKTLTLEMKLKYQNFMGGNLKPQANPIFLRQVRNFANLLVNFSFIYNFVYNICFFYCKLLIQVLISANFKKVYKIRNNILFKRFLFQIQKKINSKLRKKFML